jgi:hypothetical protein
MSLQWSALIFRSRLGTFVSGGKIPFPGNRDFGSKRRGYAKWAGTYKKETGVGLHYQSIGSGGGIKQIEAKTVPVYGMTYSLRATFVGANARSYLACAEFQSALAAAAWKVSPVGATVLPSLLTIFV